MPIQSLQYNKPLSDRWNIFWRTEFNSIGSFYWDDANALKQDSYQLVNMSLGLESDKVDIILWAKNLFDEEYESLAFEFPGSDPIGQSGDPLTMGITVRIRFFLKGVLGSPDSDKTESRPSHFLLFGKVHYEGFPIAPQGGAIREDGIC